MIEKFNGVYRLCWVYSEDPRHKEVIMSGGSPHPMLCFQAGDDLQITYHGDEDPAIVGHRIGRKTVLCKIEGERHTIVAGPLLPRFEDNIIRLHLNDDGTWVETVPV